LQRLEKEKEDEYYKFFCKTLMIDDLLSNKHNATKAKKLAEKNKTLTEKCHSSKKVKIMHYSNALLIEDNLPIEHLKSNSI